MMIMTMMLICSAEDAIRNYGNGDDIDIHDSTSSIKNINVPINDV